jgi:S-formylglutathione hydrolase FrmB
VLGIVLAVLRSVTPPRRWWRPVRHVALAAVVVLASAELANVEFGAYPNVRDALGLPQTDQVAFHTVAHRAALVRPAPGEPLSDVWHAPKWLPRKGVVAQVDIPGTVSHFAARPGWVYLPPAYLSTPRAELPVLVLVGGQPGNTDDWLDGGMLAARMDAFARAHRGLAPVVVMPDDLTAPTVNPMCLDSRLGNAFTYLTRDVPAWIDRHLQVDENPRTWAFGGFSNGGTCALELAVNAPHRYPTFLDLSGEERPSTGTLEQTVDDAFGGDLAAYRAVAPLDVLARQRFPEVAGEFVVGSADRRFLPQAMRVYHAALAAGMHVGLHELPGGHSWAVWGAGFGQALPWLAARMELVP